MDSQETSRQTPPGSTRPDPLMRRTHGLSPAPAPSSLADLLDRILDKGVIIAGDIEIKLLDIQLLTIRLRLLIASVDKADEMGIDWWRNDPWYSANARDRDEDSRTLPQGGSSGGQDELEQRLARLEQQALPAADEDRTSQLEERLQRLEQQLAEKEESAPAASSGRSRGRSSRSSRKSESDSENS